MKQNRMFSPIDRDEALNRVFSLLRRGRETEDVLSSREG